MVPGQAEGEWVQVAEVKAQVALEMAEEAAGGVPSAKMTARSEVEMAQVAEVMGRAEEVMVREVAMTGLAEWVRVWAAE